MRSEKRQYNTYLIIRSLLAVWECERERARARFSAPDFRFFYCFFFFFFQFDRKSALFSHLNKEQRVHLDNRMQEYIICCESDEMETTSEKKMPLLPIPSSLAVVWCVCALALALSDTFYSFSTYYVALLLFVLIT